MKRRCSHGCVETFNLFNITCGLLFSQSFEYFLRSSANAVTILSHLIDSSGLLILQPSHSRTIVDIIDSSMNNHSIPAFPDPCLDQYIGISFVDE